MKTQLLTAAVLAGAMSGNANAALMLEAFGGFLDNDNVDGFPLGGTNSTLVFHGPSTTVDNLYTSISWGTPKFSGGPFNGQSGASINAVEPGEPIKDYQENADPFLSPEENSVTQDPNTLGEEFVLGYLTHFNEEINQYFDPASIDVYYDFTVTDTTTGSTANFSETFPLSFWETHNLAPCNDTPNEEDSVCDDTFQFFGQDVLKFQLDGQKYRIAVIGFCDDEDSSCGVGDGIFYSAEGGTQTGFVLEVKSVPTPGVLTLLGAGLIGLGYARRRQMKV